MKVLTVRQPWASLIAIGVKTIETRSWRTSYRGPLAIHAGLDQTFVRPSTWREDRRRFIGDYDVQRDQSGLLLRGPCAPYRLPLGTVVAVCDLVDCVPMVASGEEGAARTLDCDPNGSLWIVEPQRYPTPGVEDPAEWEKICVDRGLVDGPDQREVTDQAPYGDFAPGRWAWILSDIRRLHRPVPARGAQGLRDLPEELRARVAS